MQHDDYLALLRDAVPTPGGVWADFGSGTGAYTLALAELIGPGSTIYSIDKDPGVLAAQAKQMASKYPEVTLHTLEADFMLPLQPALPPLDGLVMANALHVVAGHQKAAVVMLIKSYLKPGGRWLLVDYNVDHGNAWVPYPLAFTTWETLAHECGFTQVRLVARHPDNFLKEVYSAESMTPPPPPPAPKPTPKPAAAPVAAPAAAPAAKAAKTVATKKKAGPARKSSPKP